MLAVGFVFQSTEHSQNEEGTLRGSFAPFASIPLVAESKLMYANSMSLL